MILCRGVIYHVPNTLKFTERNVINHAPTKYQNLPESSYFALFIRTISLSQTKRANNSAKNNNSFLKKHANKKAM